MGVAEESDSDADVLHHAHFKILGEDGAHFFTDVQDNYALVFSANNEHDLERLHKFLKDCKRSHTIEVYQGPNYPHEDPNETMRVGHHIHIFHPFVVVVRVVPQHAS
jgi:hypothetical protein